MKCRECKWWCGSRSEEGYPHMGDCRLESPRVVQMGDFNGGLEYDTVWPRTNAGDWCSKWTPRNPDEGMVHISEPVGQVIEKLVESK